MKYGLLQSFLPLLIASSLAVLFSACSERGNTIVLRGASQFDENHSFNQTLRKFEELVKENYDGEVRFEIYRNSELGLEKDYFAYMSQGLSVDFAIVSPSHMSTFSKAAPIMDLSLIHI